MVEDLVGACSSTASVEACARRVLGFYPRREPCLGGKDKHLRLKKSRMIRDCLDQCHLVVLEYRVKGSKKSEIVSTAVVM